MTKQKTIEALKEQIEMLVKDDEIQQETIIKLAKENKDLQQRIDKAIEYIKEYGRDKQLEEEYLMNAYNLAMYNITLLEILGDKE